MASDPEKTKKLIAIALALAIITIVYNILEGIASIYFGLEDESLALFGFGLDSFVEVISGLGILHMVFRIKLNPVESRDKFEKTALQITGYSFYILCGGLIITAIYNIYTNHHPETTLWGIIISAVSILSMSFLVYYKLDVGTKLNSPALVADANCTKTCLYLSIILLVSSFLYTFFKIGLIDSLGAAGIAYFAYNEGKESLEKARTGKTCSCEHE